MYYSFLLERDYPALCTPALPRAGLPCPVYTCWSRSGTTLPYYSCWSRSGTTLPYQHLCTQSGTTLPYQHLCTQGRLPCPTTSCYPGKTTLPYDLPLPREEDYPACHHASLETRLIRR